MPILHFKGKSVIQNHHHTVKFHELTPVKGKSTSKEPSLDDNLIIHGDNLIGLKALLPTYAGKVKCIYIDPPYNTGNEHWRYNDNVNSPLMREWLEKEVARDDLARHEKWCCMMYPRLTLMKDLLTIDGVILVSIDDNEIEHLRMMMNEIFGEENFITSFIWRKVDSPNDNKVPVAADHEYLVSYAKSLSSTNLKQMSDSSVLEGYRLRDEKGRLYRDRLLKKNGKNSLRSDRPSMFFPLVTPDHTEVMPIHDDGTEACWAYSKEAITKLNEDGLLIWKNRSKNESSNWIPYVREFANEDSPCRPYPTIWSDLHTMRQAKAELKEIFEVEQSPFDTPKPTQLIERVLRFATDSDSIVLDSFAGSGTTGHAVLAINAEDEGNRRFILLECEDYADKLTAERVRRVSKGVKDAKDEKLQNGLGGTFSYYELGKPIDIDKMLDGKELPSFENLAHYAFFTSTGETFNPKKMNEKDFYIGSSSSFEVFLLYVPDADKLRGMALNLDFAQKIEKKFPGKPKLVFAPACFLEEFDLRERNIRFAQLPFEIYRLAD